MKQLWFIIYHSVHRGRKSTSIKYALLVIVRCIFISFMPLSLVAQNDVGEVIGEGPAVPIHMSQEDIDSNQVSFEKIKFFNGDELIEGQVNTVFPVLQHPPSPSTAGLSYLRARAF